MKTELTQTTAEVIKVINKHTVAINIGSDHGVTLSQNFLIYYEDEELFDPVTKESLGRLEIICGEGTPTHIQSKITTLESARAKTSQLIVRKCDAYYAHVMGIKDNEEVSQKTETLPFEDVKAGRLVKRIL